MVGFFEVTTMLGAVGTVVASMFAYRLARESDENYLNWTNAETKLAMAQHRLFILEGKESLRAAALSNAGRKGRALQLARAAETEPQRRADAEAARAKTIAALAGTPMRSRAQVVASVKAKRTRKKNAGAGVAAKQEV